MLNIALSFYLPDPSSSLQLFLTFYIEITLDLKFAKPVHSTSPNVNILHNGGIMIKTRKLALIQYQ